MTSVDLPSGLNELMRRFLALPEQLSTHARDIDALHYLEIVVMVGITVLIAAVIAVFCLRYPHRERARTPLHVWPARVELPVYGAILAFFILLWVIGYRQFLTMEDPPEHALDVYVTGQQWMWKFAYPEQGVASIDTLYVPAGRPVRLLITSRDVIHSFFVPALRLKRDAVPGLYNVIWFEALAPGRHPIFCTELCGTGHAQMLGQLEVLSQERFEAWAARAHDDPQRATDLVAEGRATAARHGCLICHTIDGGPAASLAMGPSWKGMYGTRRTLATGGTVLADEAYLPRSMMDPTADIVAGYAPVMPSFQGLLTPPEVASLVELIQSLRVSAAGQELPSDAR